MTHLQILTRIDAAAPAHCPAMKDELTTVAATRSRALWFEMLHLAQDVAKLPHKERKELARQISHQLHAS